MIAVAWRWRCRTCKGNGLAFVEAAGPIHGRAPSTCPRCRSFKITTDRAGRCPCGVLAFPERERAAILADMGHGEACDLWEPIRRAEA